MSAGVWGAMQGLGKGMSQFGNFMFEDIKRKKLQEYESGEKLKDRTHESEQRRLDRESREAERLKDREARSGEFEATMAQSERHNTQQVALQTAQLEQSIIQWEDDRAFKKDNQKFGQWVDSTRLAYAAADHLMNSEQKQQLKRLTELQIDQLEMTNEQAKRMRNAWDQVDAATNINEFDDAMHYLQVLSDPAGDRFEYRTITVTDEAGDPQDHVVIYENGRPVPNPAHINLLIQSQSNPELKDRAISDYNELYLPGSANQMIRRYLGDDGSSTVPVSSVGGQIFQAQLTSEPEPEDEFRVTTAGRGAAASRLQVPDPILQTVDPRPWLQASVEGERLEKGIKLVEEAIARNEYPPITGPNRDLVELALESGQIDERYERQIRDWLEGKRQRRQN